MFLHNLATFSQSFAISRWLMGGLDAIEYSTIGWLAAAVIPVSILVTLRAPQWLSRRFSPVEFESDLTAFHRSALDVGSVGLDVLRSAVLGEYGPL